MRSKFVIAAFLTVVLFFFIDSNRLYSTITKGPYLMFNGNSHTEMTVLWQTDSTESCILEWGTTIAYGNTVITTELSSSHRHKYVIPDLAYNTGYYYRISTRQESATGSFRSFPSDRDTETKFFAYGDTRTYPANHARIAAKIIETYKADPSYQTFALFVGDYNSLDEEWYWANEFFSRKQPALLKLFSEVPLMPCRGNHEQSGKVFKTYFPYPYVSSFYYSFDYGPVHVSVLDQNPLVFPMIDPEQIAWLERDLASTDKLWKVICVHAPGYSAGGHHENNLQVQTEIHPLCVRYDVSFVFSGENHYYSRAQVDGVNHITTGGGGAPLYDPNPAYPYIVATQKAYEFCKIDIKNKILTFTAMDISGNIIDTVTISKYTEPRINSDFSF